MAIKFSPGPCGCCACCHAPDTGLQSIKWSYTLQATIINSQCENCILHNREYELNWIGNNIWSSSTPIDPDYHIISNILCHFPSPQVPTLPNLDTYLWVPNISLILSDDNKGNCYWLLRITAQSQGMEERVIGGLSSPYRKYVIAEYVSQTSGGKCNDPKNLSFSQSYRSDSTGGFKDADLSDPYDFHLVYSPGASPPVVLGPLCHDIIWPHINQQVLPI